MDLARIKAILEADNFEVYLRPASDTMPLDQLAVALTGEGDDDTYILQVLFLPGLDDQISSADLLHYYAQLPVSIDAGATAEVLALLNRLARTVPLGCFGYDPSDGGIFYRYVQLIPKSPRKIDDRITLEAVWLIHFILDRFAPIVATVASGRASPADVEL